MKLLNCFITSNSSEITELHRNLFKGHIWPFLLEPEWEFVDSLESADVILFNGTAGHEDFLKKLKQHQIALMLEIFHIDDMFESLAYQNGLKSYGNADNIIIVHKNKAIPNSKNFIYYDCMFNRQKLYFTEFYKIKETPNLVWTAGSTERMFSFPKNKRDSKECNFFLSPNLIYHGAFVPRMRYRQGLQDYLNLRHKDKCFINSKDNKFLCNDCHTHLKNRIEKGEGGFWYPIADEYYERSYISVYVETITTGHYKTRCVTEKTFDPLIKGNFILPFGYPGLIKDILDYGFWLPKIGNFLDYVYDDVKDNDARFDGFLYSIHKVFSNYTIDKLAQLYNDNIENINHNRNLFFTKPYDKLYPKIKNHILGNY